MRLIKKSKKLLIFTTILSLFAVVVSGISTFAWFEVGSVTAPSVTNPSLIQSSSSNLVIDDVTGYKFKYNDVSYGVTDYEHGEPVNYAASSIKNVDQSDRKELDNPTNGEGYYVVGNSTWVNNYNTATGSSAAATTAWTYASGLRLDDDLVDGNNNKATYNDVFLSAGAEFRIRRHYLTTVSTDQTRTETYDNSWVTISGLADNDGKTTTAAKMSGDNIQIKDGQSGYYNIYLTNDSKIALYPLELRSNPRSIRIKQTRSLSAGQFVYFDVNGNTNWQDGNAIFDIRFQNTSTWAENWVQMTQLQSTGIYYAAVPSGTWTRLTLTRKSAHSTAWTNIWNYDDDRNLSNFNNTTSNCLKSTSSSDFNSMSIGSASTQILAKFSDSFAYADAKNSWAQTALTTDKACSLNGGSTTVTFTSSNNVRMYANSEFKIVNTSKADNTPDKWMGYVYYTSRNSTYFEQGPQSDGYNKTDYNVKVKANCKCIFSVTYYFNSGGWSFTISPESFSPGIYNLTIYKKNYSTNELISTQVLEHESEDSTELYYPGTPSGLTGYSAITGYSTWCGNWYSDSSCSSAISASGVSGSTDYLNPTNLYTYYTADNLDVTIIYSFLTAGGAYDSTATTTQNKANIADKCRADQNYTFRTLDTTGSPASTIGSYTFFRYSTNNTGTGTNYNPGGNANVGTTNKTYYAVYKPTEYTITWTYKFFEHNGTTSVSGPTQADENDTAYATVNYSPSSPGVTRKKYYKSSTTTFYVFVFDGWYTNTTCTTAYSAKKYSANDTIYAKMVAKEMTSVYLDTSGPNWTNPRVRVFKDGEEDFGLSNTITNGKVFSSKNTIYQLTLPTDYTMIVTSAGSYGANVQTVDIGVSSTSYDNSSPAKQRGTSDWVFLSTDKNGSNYYKFTWQTFYGSGHTDGYYLVGSSSFEGASGNTPWTFASSNLMATTNLPLSVIAKKASRTLTAGMEFKIWHYNSLTGRDGEYAVLNSDSETQEVLKINASGNIEVKTGVSGQFDIFVTESTYKVMVKDVSAATKLYVKYGSTTLPAFAMGKSTSGSSYWAAYEQGIQITNAMISAGGAYIGIVRQVSGKKTGYGTSASTYSFVDGSGSASQTFDGKTFTCLKINRAGNYNFYLTNSGTIRITSLPYLVNGSDVKTDGGDDGYYIIPYSDTYGSGTYRNGLKMNVINGESATTAEGNKNIASYSRYVASLNEKFIIKYFENNVTKYSPVEIATDTTTTACLAHEGSGVYRFKAAGVYNIFMYQTANGPAISVARDTLSDFTRLNSIPSNATTKSLVKSANTTLIIDVTFTITTPANMKISIDSIISGSGLSSYVKYGLFVDSDYSGASGTTDIQRVYNFFRDDTQYDTMSVMSSVTSLTTSSSYASGQHHAYIVIDYNPSSVATMPSNIVNNFYFVLKATQPAAA